MRQNLLRYFVMHLVGIRLNKSGKKREFMYKPVMFFVCASLPMWAFNAAEVSSETASLECIKVVLTYPGWCEIVPLKEYCARQETVFVHCAKCTVGFLSLIHI